MSRFRLPLATAAVLRVVHRLPFAQVVRVLADLPGLTVSAAAVAKQLQRLGEWLDPYYERVKLALRASPRVNGDETGWRTNGRNGYLWTLTDGRHTLYHVDKRRSGEVIEGLLGRAFDGTLTADFYSAYHRLGCPKQRCLAHLLRELRETARDSPGFAACDFYRGCRRLVKDMLALKRMWDELGDEAYTIRFTPRKQKSTWSAVNIKRAGELIEAGRMQPAGLKAFHAREESNSGIYSYENRDRAAFDPALEERFRANERAWNFFQAQPPGYRKTATHWVTSAKQEPTRLRRLDQLIADSENGRRIDQLTRPSARKPRAD